MFLKRWTMKSTENYLNEIEKLKEKIEKADASTSTVDEFINAKINTQQTTDMKRFSFDIRA